jgi:hypothetical protein
LLGGVVASAQTVGPDFCAPGRRPAWRDGFATLNDWTGGIIGDPLTCEHPDPAGTGDVHVLTTQGLVYWRKSTNALSFTSNHGAGQGHWAVTNDARLLAWIGPDVDPPSDALPLTGCRTIFDGVKPWDTDTTIYRWGGAAALPGTFGGRLLVGCLASETLGVHAISLGCFLLDDQPVLIDGKGPCTTWGSLRKVDENTLEAFSVGSCCDGYATYLRWDGTGFTTMDGFRSCLSSPPRRIPDDLGLGTGEINQFCGYR